MIYYQYIKTQSSDKWQYLPSAQYIIDIKNFKDFLNVPCKQDKESISGHAAAPFPKFTQQWTIKQQIFHLTSQLGKGG